MRLLICAATEAEIAPTLSYLTASPSPNIDVLITGVGLPVAMYAISKEVQRQRPHFMLQAGIGGSFTPAIVLGSTVAIAADAMADVGVEEEGRFRSVFDMGFAGKDTFPWQNGVLVNPMQLPFELIVPTANAVTVNEITTTDKRADYYRQQYSAGMESMEGAALHYVALMENIPFLQLRSASNFVGERSKERWVFAEAIQSLNAALQAVISNFK